MMRREKLRTIFRERSWKKGEKEKKGRIETDGESRRVIERENVRGKCSRWK